MDPTPSAFPNVFGVSTNPSAPPVLMVNWNEILGASTSTKRKADAEVEGAPHGKAIERKNTILDFVAASGLDHVVDGRRFYELFKVPEGHSLLKVVGGGTVKFALTVDINNKTHLFSAGGPKAPIGRPVVDNNGNKFIEVPLNLNITDVSCGMTHALILTKERYVYFNGYIEYMSKAVSPRISSFTKLTIPGFELRRAKMIASADQESLIVFEDSGMVGIGDVPTPRRDKFVDEIGVLFTELNYNGPPISCLKAAFSVFVMIDADQQVWAFGDNTEGLLGNISSGQVMTSINRVSYTTGKAMKDVAIGLHYMVYLSADDEVYTYGNGLYFIHGNELETSYKELKLNRLCAELQKSARKLGHDDEMITSLRISQVYASVNSVAVVTESGAILVWGSNFCYKLGSTSYGDLKVPTRIIMENRRVISVALCDSPILIGYGAPSLEIAQLQARVEQIYDFALSYAETQPTDNRGAVRKSVTLGKLFVKSFVPSNAVGDGTYRCPRCTTINDRLGNPCIKCADLVCDISEMPAQSLIHLDCIVNLPENVKAQYAPTNVNIAGDSFAAPDSRGWFGSANGRTHYPLQYRVIPAPAAQQQLPSVPTSSFTSFLPM